MAKARTSLNPETIPFLEKFFGSHYTDYFDKMRGYDYKNGYQHLHRASDVSQIHRNLVHNIEGEFADLSIPKGFPSPDALLRKVGMFLRYAKQQRSEALSILREHESIGKQGTHMPLIVALEMCDGIIDAMKHALAINEVDESTSAKGTAMGLKLKVTKDETEKHLKARIEIGKKIVSDVKAAPDFYKHFKIFKVQRDSWRRFNESLLGQLFEDPSVITHYKESTDGVPRHVITDESEVFEISEQEMDMEFGFLDSLVEQLPLFDEPKEVHKIFSAGQTFEAFLELSKIISVATSEIILIDNYVDEKTLSIFSTKDSSVSLKIITMKRSITPNFKMALTTFTTQCGPTEVRTAEDIHDRFIIVDGKKVVQIGGSAKDLGKKTATLIYMDDGTFSKAIVAVANAAWKSAAII